MNEIKSQQARKHSVVIDGRNKMSVEGVEDVISFDEWQAVLVTSLGEMTVDGRGLRVSVLELESGRVELNGEIDGVVYSSGDEPEKKRGFFARVFG